MSDNPRRLLLRLSAKILGLAALLLTAYAFITSTHEGGTNRTVPLPPLEVDIRLLPAATAQRLEWAGGTLQLLRMEANGPVYLFYDRGGSLGCPLVWQPAGTTQAPTQPWRGGFRDQCNATWYHYNGEVVAGQGINLGLSSPPHRLRNGNLLEIGVNGDNAAPAEVITN